MTNDEIKNFVEKVINEKIQTLLNRIDTFQSNMFRDIEKLKDLDELVKFKVPEDFVGGNGAGESGSEITILNEYVKKIAAASNQLILIGGIIEGINHF
ncbi:MAG: hypothetical protein E4H23_12210, partial [Chrysiogenales bacterium]